MRGFWRTLAYMAEDANGFNQQLAALTDSVEVPDLIDELRFTDLPGEQRMLNLRNQPTPDILARVDQFLTPKGLILTAYELAEVNRICNQTKTEQPPHKDLKAYWSGLGPVATDNRGDNNFMEAVGALSVDGWARNQFAAGNMTMSKWFSPFPSGQEQRLRAAIAPGTFSDAAAKAYFRAGWGGHQCASILTPSADWVHFNA